MVKTEMHAFKPYAEETVVHIGDEHQRIVDALEKSSTALFSNEIADLCGVSNKRVSTILFQLVNEKEPVVHKAGWRRRREDRRELMFRNGYLYYTKLDQLKERIAKCDVLKGQKQALYDRIRKNTGVDRQFTKLIDIAKELGVYSKTIAEYLEEVSCVYNDLSKKDIAGSSYYHLTGVLTEGEIKREGEYPKTRKSEESSYKLARGKILIRVHVPIRPSESTQSTSAVLLLT